MTLQVRRFVAILIVAVTVMAGGLNGYLANAGHSDAADVSHVLGGVQSTHDHDQPHGTATARYMNVDVNNHADCGEASCGDEEHADHAWLHVHAHCCGSSAVIPGYAGLERFGISGNVVFALTATLPSGNMFFPLLRPPRTLG